MNIHNVFICQIDIFTKSDDIYDYSKKVQDAIVYKRGSKFIDLNTKEKYTANPQKIGEKFVNLNCKFFSITDIINFPKTNMSRRQIINTIAEYQKEREEKKKIFQIIKK